MTREPIYQALFAKLQTITGVNTFSRRLELWSDVQPPNQPAIFQAQVKERQEPRKGLPAKVILEVNVYLYVYSGNDMNVVPATQLNQFMDAIEAALAPDVNGVQTLGGTVSHCWIEGETITDEGVLGPQAIAIIPVRILANH
ncbi:hypothetical protein [Trinickia mobilis]|uniref:hypothetical protein n=1 Tax=Trinickia mobilis TaxID=2816356 RepID=UPI001A8D1288|nr:hypothetical protein [Trinickia mobilis]